MLALLSLLASGQALSSAPNLGMYILLADDTDKTYTSDYDWKPELYPYQLKGADILFFTFINPNDMPAVPPAYANLAKTRGSGQSGAVPSTTTIMFAIGGEAYSADPNPWPFLESMEAAEAMAAEVAKWPEQYGCDGIDLDIETGAGAASGAQAYLPYFVAKVKELNPSMVVTQPVFGSPTSVPAANRVIEAAFNKTIANGISPYSYGSLDRIGIMVYSGDSALVYVDNYAKACTDHCTEWWCPLAACVPTEKIFLGADGGASNATISLLASDVTKNSLGGIMVWYASVLDRATTLPALVYGSTDDASNESNNANQASWAQALSSMQKKRSHSVN